MNSKDLVNYAFDYITDTTNEIEELRMWDSYGIAEQLAQEIEVNVTAVEWSDKQYSELVDMLDKLIKEHEEEIDSKIEQYINECTLQEVEWSFA